MSAVGDRAVGQRRHDRCERPSVFERQVPLVDVDQGVADDDRAAFCGAEQVGKVAYCSPPASAAADSAAMPDSFTAVELSRRAGGHVVEVPDRQIGT